MIKQTKTMTRNNGLSIYRKRKKAPPLIANADAPISFDAGGCGATIAADTSDGATILLPLDTCASAAIPTDATANGAII
jgi:hypothetical protein